ncbi:MAG: hypothetical protein HYS86_02080 [Candidatus Chisholmbacteria bacterium]|nr:hypothetical protein [Candidatus Chisholmbacteria bacterium]
MAEAPQPASEDLPEEQDPVEGLGKRQLFAAVLGATAGILGTTGTGLLLFGQHQEQEAERFALLTAALKATEQQLAAAREELDTVLDQLGGQWQTNAELVETLNALQTETPEAQRHQAFQAIKEFEQVHTNDPIDENLVAQHAELLSRLLQTTYPHSLALHQIHTTPRLVPPVQISGVHARTITSTNGTAEILISDQFPPLVPDLDRLTQLRLLLEHQLVYAATPYPYGEATSDGSSLFNHGFKRITLDVTGNKTILWENVDAATAALLAITIDPEIPLDAANQYVTTVFGEPTAQKMGALLSLLQAAGIRPEAIANLYFYSQSLAFAASLDILLNRQGRQVPERFTALMLTLIDTNQLVLFRRYLNSLPFPPPGQEVNT